MPLSYADQLREHLTFLQAQGLDVSELQVNAGFVRCHQIGETKGRPDLAYKTATTRLQSGLLGLATWCRCLDGERRNFQTYGHGPNGDEYVRLESPEHKSTSQDLAVYEEVARKAYGFWQHSSTTGESDYLKRKGVGAYGIRFRYTEQYGNAAVVPMRDIDGRLWSYQLLNADGSKHNAKGGRVSGLSHSLQPIINRKPFGIAESYVTAATCMEITGIPAICAFSSHNLKEVARAWSLKCPDSPIIIFADNDRHLASNKGLDYAREAAVAIGDRAIVTVPDFGDRTPSRDESDWNDLVRIAGKEVTLKQLNKIFQEMPNSS